MATKIKRKRPKLDPDYLASRTELLVQLALVRIGGLKIHKFSEKTDDLLVVTEEGFCIFVQAKGFSYLAAGTKNADSDEAWVLRCDPEMLARARAYRNPIVLFYFNADTDHGRYLRLDTSPDANAKELRFPIENTITKASVQKLIREMQAVPKTSRAS